MTAEHAQGDEPLIAMPALTLDALRQAVAAVAPSRLPEFFQEIQEAFSQAGDEDSVTAIRHFYQRWGATVAIERRPSVRGGGVGVGQIPVTEPAVIAIAERLNTSEAAMVDLKYFSNVRPRYVPAFSHIPGTL